jgi:hypothetical protein
MTSHFIHINKVNSYVNNSMPKELFMQKNISIFTNILRKVVTK